MSRSPTYFAANTRTPLVLVCRSKTRRGSRWLMVDGEFEPRLKAIGRS
jgi:hypothetical protein